MQQTETQEKLFSACNLLIAVNCAVMVYATVINPLNIFVPDRQTLIQLGANFGLLTCSGEYWRLITSMFLHLGVIHLGINMYGLRCVGPVAESLFGWRNFLLIYFFSGIMGSLSSSLNDPLNVSVGASGAIFGVYGSLLAFLYVQREKYPPETLRYHAMLAGGLFLCNVIYGFLEPGIDNFAHLGGVLSGVFAGMLLARLEVRERWRAAYAVPVLLLMVAMLGWVTQRRFEERGFGEYRAGLQALKEQKYELAVDKFSAFIARNPSEPSAYGSRGIVYSKLGKLDLAGRDFSKVIALLPHSAEPYNSRAWVEAGLREYEKAVEDASISLQLNRRAAATFDTRGYAFAKLGQTDKALDDFAAGIKIDNNDTACHYHRMRLLDSLGRTADADQDRGLAGKYHKETWEE